MKNSADVVCATRLEESGPGRKTMPRSRLAVGRKHDFYLWARNNTAVTRHPSKSLLPPRTRHRAEGPIAEQNGPQMAHSLLGWIAANVVSY